LFEVWFYTVPANRELIKDKVAASQRAQAHASYLEKAASAMSPDEKVLLEKYGARHAGLLAMLGDWALSKGLREPTFSAEAALNAIPGVFPEIVTNAKKYEDEANTSADELVRLYKAILPSYREEYGRLTAYAPREAQEMELAINQYQPIEQIEKYSGLKSDPRIRDVYLIMESRLVGATNGDDNGYFYLTVQHPTVFDAQNPLQAVHWVNFFHEYGHSLFKRYIVKEGTRELDPSGKMYRKDFSELASQIEKDPTFRQEMDRNYLGVPGLAFEECIVRLLPDT
jgi:hypothetical protein